MPLTPFHLGPGLLLGLLLFRRIDFSSFIIANVILDIEPLMVLLLGLNSPLHGFSHSFLGGSVVALILAFVMTKLKGRFRKIMAVLKLEQESSAKNILSASFLGIYLHILLDSPLYADIRPLFPLNVNPFYSSSMFVGLEIYGICVISFVLGAVLYAYRALRG